MKPKYIKQINEHGTNIVKLVNRRRVVAGYIIMGIPALNMSLFIASANLYINEWIWFLGISMYAIGSYLILTME